MFNNVFAIKEVIDSESFDDNHRVLKEVVELLQTSKFEYAISTIAIHVIGSLIFTLLGIFTYQLCSNH